MCAQTRWLRELQVTALAPEVVLLARALPRLLCLVLALYVFREGWRSVKHGYLTVYGKRVDRSAEARQFWMFVGVLGLGICVLLYGVIAGLA